MQTMCADCLKPIINGEYGKTADNSKICYECCGVRDAKEMLATGKATLYLGATLNLEASSTIPVWELTNWTGTLRIPVLSMKTGNHNMCGKNGRTDVWFKAFGANWHGTRIGKDTQLTHCKKLTTNRSKRVG